MVNPGHPSKGCTTCKLRRIKCDETQPECLKCASSKRMCLGYDGQKSNDPYSDEKQLRARVRQSGVRSLQTTCRDLAQHVDAERTIIYQKRPPESGLIQRLQLTQMNGAGRAIQCAIEAMEAGLESLQEPSQTFEARRKLQNKYRSAIHNLRSMVSSNSSSKISFIPTYMFALYEMIVNHDPNDKTWLAHLDGFLAILRQWQPGSSEAPIFTLICALKILERGHNAHVSAASLVKDDVEKASLLMDIAKLRLRQLASEMGNLVCTTKRPRKLDMQKLRVSLKQVYGNILLIPSLLSSCASDSAKQNEYNTILIVAASLLMDSGEFLQSTKSYSGTREYIKLSRVIQEAVNGICASVPQLLSDNVRSTNGLDKIVSFSIALLAIWPLYGAFAARGISTTQRRWIQAALWRIGEEARIPKALSLATTGEHDARYSDILAGLVLGRAGAFLNLDC